MMETKVGLLSTSKNIANCAFGHAQVASDLLMVKYTHLPISFYSKLTAEQKSPLVVSIKVIFTMEA